MGTNTAHPLETPSMVSYIVPLLNVLLPMAFVCFLCYFLNRRKLGVILFTIMTGCWAIGGLLLAKRYVPPTPGVLPTESWTFGILLTAVIIILGALSLFPAAAIGPINEFLTQ